MNSKAGWASTWMILAVGLACLALAVRVSAQVKTETTTTTHAATISTQVESGKVVTVSGNDLVVKMADGTIRHFANVPESARVAVDGQELGKTITTVQSVTGKVWNVMPPVSVILTLEDGKNQRFSIPKGQKFNVNGQMVDAWGLKKGMTISATKIVEVPENVVSQQRKVTGSEPVAVAAAAPPPQPPPADVPILIAVLEVPEPVPAELPQTASPLPVIGLMGFLMVASSLGLRTARKGS